jgi:hypothetical protein
LALAWVLWPWLAALGVEALLARAPRALGTLLLSSTSLLLSLSVAWSRTRPEDLGPRLERVLVERYGQRFGTTVEDVRARIPAESALRAGRHLEESLARALAASAALALGGLLALFLDRRRSRFERGPPRVPLLLGGALLIGVSLLPLAAAGGPARLPQALAGLSALLLFVAIGLRTSRAELVLWLPLACALLLEGFLGARGHVGGRAILGAGLFPPSRSIDAVREAAGDGRVLRLDGSARPLERIVQLARPNLLVAYGINDLTPYPTFTPRELTELFTALDPRSFYRNHVSHLSRPELLDHPLLDLLRVQAILSYEPVVHPRLAALLERPGFCVYRRSGALPVARIVPAALAGASDEQVVRALVAAGADPARATWIAPEHAAALAGVPVPDAGADWQPGAITALERPARNRLALEIRGSRGGWLVVHEQWAEGWRARVDGGPEQPVLRADHAFRALPIPAGDLRVELSYAPRSLEWGALASALALLGVLVWELLRAPAENSGPEPG